MLRTVKFLALVAMFIVALSTSAQVTTSALSGVVTDENQQAMIGATITALHTPSGTKYNAATNMDGPNIVEGVQHPEHLQKEYEKDLILERVLDNLFRPSTFLFIVLIISLIKGKNIMIRFLDFKMQILSKQEKKKRK